jgi:hypothetical protein
MPLSYYSRTADSDFWTEHWGTHSVDLSLGVVEHDPAGPAAIVAEAARILAPGGRKFGRGAARAWRII